MCNNRPLNHLISGSLAGKPLIYIHVNINKVLSSIFVKQCSIHMSRAKYVVASRQACFVKNSLFRGFKSEFFTKQAGPNSVKF